MNINKINLENAIFYFNNALELFEKCDYLNAEINFRKSLDFYPNRHSTLTNLSATLIKLNKVEQALDIINKNLELFPNDPINHLNLGNLYLKQNNLSLALEAFLSAIEYDNYYFEAYNNYAFTLQRFGNWSQALIYYDKAIDLNDTYVEAYYNKSQCLIMLENYSEALIHIEKALLLDKYHDNLLITYINLLLKICKWDNLNFILEDLLSLIKNNSLNISSIFCFLAIFDDPKLHLEQSIKYSHREYPIDNTLVEINKFKNSKIKIGYFSADFHNHATSYLINELFKIHDKSQFEIHLFSYGPNYNDQMRINLINSADYFYDVKEFSDSQTAEFARLKLIDIGIDLKGYTLESRPAIFAKRFAPIQINYLGYPGTMGAEFIDYIIADRTVIPDESRIYYTENIIYLPDCYQVNDSKREISNIIYTRTEEGLPENCIVFCCFNNLYKITPEIFHIWINILKKVDNSVLWILSDNEIANENLTNTLSLHNIDSNRIIFAKRKPLNEHLSRIRLADLFLDTFPYNAHTTASDALWAGLPILTCIGNSFASRVTASLLKSINVPELITTNFSEYMNRAIELALSPNLLIHIKNKIKYNKFNTPLFNTILFTKNIEKAYKEVMSIYTSNSNKRDIYVK